MLVFLSVDIHSKIFFLQTKQKQMHNYVRYFGARLGLDGCTLIPALVQSVRLRVLDFRLGVSYSPEVRTKSSFF